MEAMDKVRDEMAKTKNSAVETLGEWMTAWLEAHPEGGEKVLAEGKTLEGAYKAMENYARQHIRGNVAYVSPRKAVETVAQYFEIDAEQLTQIVKRMMMEQLLTMDLQLGEEGTAGNPERNQEPQADAESLTGVLDLDALLGGL